MTDFENWTCHKSEKNITLLLTIPHIVLFNTVSTDLLPSGDYPLWHSVLLLPILWEIVKCHTGMFTHSISRWTSMCFFHLEVVSKGSHKLCCTINKEGSLSGCNLIKENDIPITRPFYLSGDNTEEWEKEINISVGIELISAIRCLVTPSAKWFYFD